MKLKNVLIVVTDIEKSKKFYHGLFGLEVLLDSGENVILTEGLVLQEKKLWEATIQKTVCPKSHSTELYFEERNIEAFAEKLNNYEEPVKYVTPLTCNAWERKVIRFYDPDGTLIEVGETR